MPDTQALKGSGGALTKVWTAAVAAPLRPQLTSNGALLPPPPASPMAISPTQMASGQGTSSLTASADRWYASMPLCQCCECRFTAIMLQCLMPCRTEQCETCYVAFQGEPAFEEHASVREH